MRLTLADHAGFCFGVRRAINIAFKAVEESKKPIYSLGPLIHNPQEVRRLEEKGIYEASDIGALKEGDTVIIRTHGTSPQVLEELTSKGVNVVNATCPFVVKAQKLAEKLYKDGYQVVIVGEGDHPEVVGILGFTMNDAWVIQRAEDVKCLPSRPRIGVVAQTTQSLDNFKSVVCALVEKTDELKIFNTICHATSQRQASAIELAKKVDIMIVVGGRNSANTTRLASLCRSLGVKTYHIETAEEIDMNWFDNAQEVGVTAGASTPDWVIQDVLNKIRSKV